jgi:myo-inositol-1-phosphate synthase
MVRVALIGQGYVATIFAWGLSKIKAGKLEPYGVPLGNLDLGVGISDLEIVGSIDVDEEKVGKSLYEVAKKYGLEPEPELRDIYVSPGLALRSTPSFLKVKSLDSGRSLGDAYAKFEEWLDDVKPDVVIDVTSTVNSEPILSWEEAEEKAFKGILPHSQVYAYLLLRRGNLAHVNLQPAYVAGSPGFVKRAEQSRSLVLGDDGATGATPLTIDLAEHLKERNRKILSIAQFNIGGNTDFLALMDPDRNDAKERTKSSFLKDILGYDPPHYIRPTGYLEPLGDKKFVSMHLQWVSFGGFIDELVVNMRINDSPALAGYIVDLARLGFLAVKKGLYGTLPEVNRFYMKRPGPMGARHVSKIRAYYDLVAFAEELKKK